MSVNPAGFEITLMSARGFFSGKHRILYDSSYLFSVPREMNRSRTQLYQNMRISIRGPRFEIAMKQDRPAGRNPSRTDLADPSSDSSNLPQWSLACFL
jgi:hypothetical protein